MNFKAFKIIFLICLFFITCGMIIPWIINSSTIPVLFIPFLIGGFSFLWFILLKDYFIKLLKKFDNFIKEIK